MNYLAHYYIDNQVGNAHYNAGLIIPDLARGYFKAGLLHHVDASNNPYKDIFAGCVQHIASDKKFHASAFFVHYLNEVNAVIKKTAFSQNLQRKWFLAHILFELLLDRTILKSHQVYVDRFYEDLGALTDKDLTIFIGSIGVTAPDGFITRYRHFTQVQYIRYYTDNNKFVYSLNRIMIRAGLSELNITDALNLRQVVLELENTYFAAQENILNEMRHIFTER
ncbi:MAG: hypothetical protein ACK574_07885 [Bacteroidota bacterium]